jgi:hypothetical protein
VERLLAPGVAIAPLAAACAVAATAAGATAEFAAVVELALTVAPPTAVETLPVLLRPVSRAAPPLWPEVAAC